LKIESYLPTGTYVLDGFLLFETAAPAYEGIHNSFNLNENGKIAKNNMATGETRVPFRNRYKLEKKNYLKNI